MTAVLFSFSVYTLLSVLLYVSIIKTDIVKKKKLNSSKPTVWTFFAVSLIAKLAISAIYKGFEADMTCFSAWSASVFYNGIGSFYTSGTFADYPPGYVYVMYLLGGIRNLFHVETLSYADVVILKAPAVICDIVTGYLIYKCAGKKFGQTVSLVISFLYIFNPVAIINSSVWGQVDSVYTLFLVLSIIFISEDKLFPAYLSYIIGLLIKPQMAIFAPVIIFATLDYVLLPKFEAKKLWKIIGWGVSSIALFVVCCLPFGLMNVINQYVETMSSYNYISVNAYNLYGIFGLNWVETSKKILFLTYSQLGTIFILLIVASSTWIYIKNFKNQSKDKYFYIAAFIITAMFILSVRMHERYMFPAVVLLVFAFIHRPSKKTALLFLLLSLCQFLNAAHVLFFYDPSAYDRFDTAIVLTSLLSVASFAYMLYITYVCYIKGIHDTIEPVSIGAKKQKPSVKAANKPSDGKNLINSFLVDKTKMTRIDIIILAAIMLAYSCVALYNLGENVAPQTYWTGEQGDTIVMDFGENVNIKKVRAFLGTYHDTVLNVEYSQDGETTTQSADPISINTVFSWQDADTDITGRYIYLTNDHYKIMLNELVLYDQNGNTVVPVYTSAPELFDEQDTSPERISYRNGTYFDEIYHARTAFEHLNGIYPYEITHPPLGKLLIGIGIKLFGMTPFGWRIVGTLFGIFMLPFIYLFAKRIFKHTWLAAAACLLFAFDFMHFTQTRIATIDVYVTFFVIAMYYYMYKYWTMDLDKTPFVKTLIPLAMSGLCMGLGIASKWPGVYAGAGLAVLLFTKWGVTLYAKYNNEQERRDFLRFMLKSTLMCVIFFVAVPAVIYALSYIPFIKVSDSGALKTIIDNQKYMFEYHSALEATHPYSSWWYQWPTIVRPIFYYCGNDGDLKEGISAFGNPAVWWMGILAFAYMIYLLFKKRDKTALFLIIAYLAQYVPWMPVSYGRITFIYHYFPCTPFVVLMICYSIYTMYNDADQKWQKRIVALTVAYVAVAVILFAMFYPVLSGKGVSGEYVEGFLRWFDSWVLVI